MVWSAKHWGQLGNSFPKQSDCRSQSLECHYLSIRAAQSPAYSSGPSSIFNISFPFFFFFNVLVFGHAPCRILVTWPRIEPVSMPPALGMQSLNHWTTIWSHPWSPWWSSSFKFLEHILTLTFMLITHCLEIDLLGACIVSLLLGCLHRQKDNVIHFCSLTPLRVGTGGQLIFVKQLSTPGYHWHLKKYSQPKSWVHACSEPPEKPLKTELCFNPWEFLQLQALKTASQVTLRELLWGGKGRSQVIQKFSCKGQVVWTSKDYC